ncbi:hypothetical protein [Metaclostridioides mangenotii]|uniref:hypothetical protein n=1 Tax=Metaclostridioides mangenotii TaxID=1540 RepID=UPI000482651F|nr:hypothetical protein [Clostridioides mangenotii]
MSAKLIEKNIKHEDGTEWDRLYKVGNSSVFISYAKHSKEENDKVLEEIKQVNINILKNLASETVTG